MAGGISVQASRFKGKNMQKIEWDSPAELVEVAENPLPGVGDAGYLFARDGKKLRNAVFMPPRVARGTIVLMTGCLLYTSPSPRDS